MRKGKPSFFQPSGKFPAKHAVGIARLNIRRIATPPVMAYRTPHMPTAKTDLAVPPTEAAPLPEFIRTEAELEEVLTRPDGLVIEAIKTVSSPLVLLGAGGKMGPTLAVLAKRAAEAAGRKLEVVAASRFSSPTARDWLEQRGVRTMPCDLLEPEAVFRLPDAENVLHLAGMKFGTRENPSATWALNTLVPARVVERYASARIVALSTGNVYPLDEAPRGGSLEIDPLTPQGEYANAAVGSRKATSTTIRSASSRQPRTTPSRSSSLWEWTTSAGRAT